jgi:hypothetical protein
MFRIRHAGWTVAWMPVLASLLVLVSTPAHADTSWSSTFADERDTVVFLTPHALVRAPFSLATVDTLWRSPDDMLVRVLASPDGRRLAWLTRASDRSVTTLWLWDRDGTRRRAAFASLRPSDYESSRSASMRPTLDDADATGARFATAGTFSRTSLSNAMAWDWDGSGVWFGFRDGIVRAPVDTDSVRVMSPALTLALRRLDPAPMLLAEVMRLDKGRYSGTPWVEPTADGRWAASPAPMPPNPDLSSTLPVTGSSDLGARVVMQLGTYLLYPARRDLRAFRVDGFDTSDPWTASEETVWWLDGGKRVSAVRATDPRRTREFEDRETIVWFEYLPSRRSLVRATGRQILERSESGGEDRLVLATASPIQTVLRTPGDSARYVVTNDSLIVWQPATGVTRGVRLGGQKPRRVAAAANGVRVFVTGGFGDGGGTPQISRLDPGASRLVRLDVPETADGAVTITPSGRRLLLYPVTEGLPKSIQVFDLEHGGWTETNEPTLLGWERLVR